jgi:uncharacterized protein
VRRSFIQTLGLKKYGRQSPQQEQSPRRRSHGAHRTSLRSPEWRLVKTSNLISLGLDPRAKDDNGFTPLHFSTQSNSLPVSEALIAAGAEINASDNNGNTPLSNAVFYSGGKGDLIILLLSAGADPHQENRHGVSPIGLARTMANPDLIAYFNKES